MEQLIAQWLPWVPESMISAGAAFMLRLFLAAVYLVVGLWLSGWLSRRVGQALNNVPQWDNTLTPPLARLTWLAGLVVTGYTILTTFGVQTAAILAVLSGVALTIGLAVQGTLANVAAGIMLLILRPMRNGQFVWAGGAEGNVVEINLFRTKIRTLTGAYVSVPNSNVFGDKVISYGGASYRSLWEPVGISYDADIDQARAIILDILANDERWFPDPEPKVYVSALADFSVNLTVTARCSTTDYFVAKSEFLEAVKKRFDAEGVGIPFPTRTVHMIDETKQA